MNIFLAPRSSETSYENFLSTIESGIDYSIIEADLNDDGKRILGKNKKVFAWGNKETKKASWNKMKVGDLVLFYKGKERGEKEGKFIYAGYLIFKQQSKNLGLSLWPHKKGQAPWSCVFFLDSLKKIHIPISRINNLSEGRYKMDRVQGFMPLNEVVHNNIIKRYDSIDKFITKYSSREILNLEIPKKESIKTYATRFEEKIKNFLIDLEFSDVDGARDSFRVNGFQIDVCGGWDKTLLIIECKAKINLGRKSLRKIINEFRGKIPIVKSGFKKIDKYKKYKFFKYIILTNNIDVRDEDLLHAKRYNPSIHIWSDDFFQYYSDLYKFIKPYTKFDLLGELGVKPYKAEIIKIPAFQTKIDNVNMYNFVINPKDLLQYAFVARREVGDEKYYQRIIDENRLKRMAKYIEEGGRFPNNIIIAFDNSLKIKFRSKKITNKKVSIDSNINYGMLEFPRNYRSCWIIDGQHRLYSFVGVEKDFYFNMPITAFENLDIKQQRKFFLDINKNQKPVDSDLLWDLNGDIPNEKDGIISNLTKFLNKDNRGSLYGRIYYPSTGIKNRKKLIKISAICIAIKKQKIVDQFTTQNIKNPFFDNDPINIIKKLGSSLIKYSNILKEEFPNNWGMDSGGFLLTNGGFAVMLGLYEKILSRTMQKNKKEPNEEDFRIYLNPLKNILDSSTSEELKQLRLRCTSEAGKTELLNEFILKYIRPETGDNNFGGDNIGGNKLRDDIDRLDKRLKELIKNKLYRKNNKNWLKNLVDDITYIRISKNMKKDGMTDLAKEHYQLSFGQCFDIIKKNENIFYPIFVDENKEYAFTNKDLFQGAINNVTAVRNSFAHYKGSEIKAEEKAITEHYLRMINRCLDEELIK